MVAPRGACARVGKKSQMTKQWGENWNFECMDPVKKRELMKDGKIKYLKLLGELYCSGLTASDCKQQLSRISLFLAVGQKLVNHPDLAICFVEKRLP